MPATVNHASTHTFAPVSKKWGALVELMLHAADFKWSVRVQPKCFDDTRKQIVDNHLRNIDSLLSVRCRHLFSLMDYGVTNLLNAHDFFPEEGKHRPATGCHAPRAETWIQAWGKMDIKEARAAPGPERARAATPR